MSTSHCQLFTAESVQQFTTLIDQFLNFNSSKSQYKREVKEIEQKIKFYSKSDLFFQIAFEFIMNKNDATYEQLFLVSLLLRDKFRYEFDKYSDQQSIEYLENMLKQIINKYSEHPPDTFSYNICLCMICLYIKRAERLHEKFKQAGILEYFKSFVLGNASSDYFYKALQNTPSAAYSSKIVMDQTQKDRIRLFVKHSQYEVLKHLNSVAAELWEKKIIKKSHLFSALENWISAGFQENLFQELPNHFLVQKLFTNCLDSASSTEATNCLKTIIKKIKIVKKQDPLFLFLGSGVFNLVQLIKSHLKQFDDGDQVNEAIEVVSDFGILATEFFITNYNADVKNYLQALVLFLKIQDLDAFPNLLDFFEGYTKEIQRTQTLNNEHFEILKNAYASVCYQIKWSFQMIQKMNDISEHNLSNFYSQAELIIERRNCSQSFFESLAFTFRQQNYLNFVVNCISQLPKNQPEIFWPYLETYLFTLKDAVKNFPFVSENLQLLTASYSQINEYVAIKLSYMNLFKNMMSIKQPNQVLKSQFIQHLFMAIASNLIDPKIQEKAQRAFSKGCQENPQIVINYLQNFIKLLKQNEGNQQIVKGIMHVIGSNIQTMQKYLPSVLEVLFQVFSSAGTPLKKAKSYHSFSALFKILITYKQKALFRQALVNFTKLIWPAIINTLKEPKDIRLDEDPQIQMAVKLVKLMMRCLSDGFIPFLQSLFTTVLQAYMKYPICSYIYMLEVSITVFYNDSTLTDYFRGLYQSFCQVTYSHLKQAQNSANVQLLIDDFIGMNKRFFIFNSKIVLESGELPRIIETCIELSNLIDVPHVSKSAYQFFETIFMVYWRQNFIKKYNDNEYGDKFQKNPKNQILYNQLKLFIIPKLPDIIMKMINHLQKVPLQSTAECIMDALNSEIKGFPDINREIWTPILEKIPCDILTNSEKTIIYENLTNISSENIDKSEEASRSIDKIIYIMNKRFINSYKRKL